MAIQELGTFRCTCCCSDHTVHNDDEVELGYMRCTGCRCVRLRTGAASTLMLRIQVVGIPTIKHLEDAVEMARSLGSPDDIPLQSSGGSHYFEISAAAAQARLEIQKLKGH